MANPTVEFTHVTELRAEALGESGQRTFRILVASSDNSATMWLEKEQLFQLALAITQLVLSLSDQDESLQISPEQISVDPPAKLEFRIGKIVLAQDNVSDRLVIDAHDMEPDEDGEPTIRIWGNLTQLKEFSEGAIRVCAAGRPMCPLCGNPIEPSRHKCPRTNGHGVIDLQDL